MWPVRMLWQRVPVEKDSFKVVSVDTSVERKVNQKGGITGC